MLDEMDKAQQPNPQVEQLKMRGAVAEVAETESKAALNMAKANKEGQPEMPQGGQGYEGAPELQDGKIVAEIEALLGKAAQSKAAAFKAQQEGMLAPVKAAHDMRTKEQTSSAV